ncbi:hypothetical protein, partial [Thermoleptolyngbya sp. M55_K2018_002]|uniref:hypothetical protein n=1 Tax=Thermoleptolyngbya sp. M55_K2018_002 TaxID=2747808 RepID=UPI0025EDC398
MAGSSITALVDVSSTYQRLTPGQSELSQGFAYCMAALKPALRRLGGHLFGVSLPRFLEETPNADNSIHLVVP